MLLLMIERGLPIDLVLTADTGMEFPEMYRHWDRVEQYLFQKRGLKLTILRHPRGFEWLMFNDPKSRRSCLENRALLGVPPYGNGWPGIKVRWCTGQLKTHLIRKEVNRLKQECHALHYVGIAADEPKRIEQEQYPLVEWGIAERQALQICYDRGYTWDGLYELYNRCSCWCCPLQRIGELRTLRQRHPQLWTRLLDIDRRAIDQFGTSNPLGQFKKEWTVEQLEQRFAAEEQQRALFVQGGSTTVKNNKNDPTEEVRQMLKGTPPQNILISFDGKPPQSLEEHAKRLEKQRRKKQHRRTK